MKKVNVAIFILTVLLIMITPKTFQGALKQNGPVLIVTAEYTPYTRLMEPDLVGLFKKYGIAINLCVRENQLNDDLDKLYTIYEKEGIPILFWPLLPAKDGLYLNRHTTGVYLNYLDVIFDWAESHGHKIQALVVDIEPSNFAPEPGAKRPGMLATLKNMRKDLDRDAFDASIPEFEKIIKKLHDHDCLAIAATFPFVIDDRKKGRHAWEDVFGGPVATLDWDYLAVMMYSSWFVEFGGRFGVDWDAAHYLAYEWSRDLKAIWGAKAAVAVGVTNAGTGQEKIIYSSPEQLAPAIAAVRAAGIENVGIYDLKGILDAGNPEAWLKMLVGTAPMIPQRGKAAAHRFRNFFKLGGFVIERMR